MAQDCGFSQQSYFNRLFLRAYHCTPRQYRIDKSPRKVYV
ncbi:helix-turn-helix domain-containing protein [Kandleria vitulina]|nr:AraC family transcriptional regulator [Kandleria vitulina]